MSLLEALQAKKLKKAAPVEAKIVEKPTELTAEERARVDAQVEGYRALSSTMHQIAHIKELLPLIQAPEQSLVAFDFDQTLTEKGGLRGGEEALKTLEYLRNMGAHLMVVTATPPSRENARSIATNMEKIGVENIFGVQPVDLTTVRDYLKNLGDNATMDLRTLTLKTALLVVLHSSRYAVDMERVGAWNCQLNDDAFEVYLQQIDGQNIGAWSVPQVIGKEGCPELCPLLACAEYVKRTAETRHPAGPEREPGSPPPTMEEMAQDRLFVSWEDGMSPLTNILALLSEMCAEAGMSERDRMHILTDSTREHDVDGVKLVQFGNLWCSAYNKPDAIRKRIHDDGLSDLTDIFFVDDNADNVCNVFSAFADKQLEDPTRLAVHSFWLPPYEGGVEENCALTNKALVLGLSEPAL